MKTHEILNELFDKPYPYELTSLGATFKDKTGALIGVYFEDLDIRLSIYGLAFLGGSNYSGELTNNRDSIKVLSTVVAIADVYIRKDKPRAILFTSEKADIGRSELYSKLVKKLASKYGYIDVSEKLGSILLDNDFGDALRKESRWHSPGKSYDSFVLVRKEELR